mmetsp:Transcript_29605/g.62230  ORF Transcript_29605/g.62230 Transcript_29605/m.62230 type:complete len:202 (+) Transcript_29605:399-1004(+)
MSRQWTILGESRLPRRICLVLKEIEEKDRKKVKKVKSQRIRKRRDNRKIESGHLEHHTLNLPKVQMKHAEQLFSNQFFVNLFLLEAVTRSLYRHFPMIFTLPVSSQTPFVNLLKWSRGSLKNHLKVMAKMVLKKMTMIPTMSPLHRSYLRLNGALHLIKSRQQLSRKTGTVCHTINSKVMKGLNARRENLKSMHIIDSAKQ